MCGYRLKDGRSLEVGDQKEPAINLASQLWTEWGYVHQQFRCIASNGAAASGSGIAWLESFQESTKGSPQIILKQAQSLRKETCWAARLAKTNYLGVRCVLTDCRAREQGFT